MIELATGNITIRNADIVVGASTTRDAFLASLLGRNAKIEVDNEPYRTYRVEIAAGDFMPLPSILRPSFYHQKLEAWSIFALDDRFDGPWDGEWEDRELLRKDYHEQWLEEIAVPKSAFFAWGEISSVYDERSDSSFVSLRYSWKGKPWRSSRASR